MTKILEMLNNIAEVGTERYARLSLGWRVALWPAYTVCAILWFAGELIVLPLSILHGRFVLGISFTEMLEAFKEGINEGLNDLNK